MATPGRKTDLQALLTPRSIAVLGASLLSREDAIAVDWLIVLDD